MSTSSKRGRRHGGAGFTLIELLVALVISGLLAGVLFQLIQGQERFVSFQSAREEVQQNSRGALELMASELRSVPAGAIDSAGANGIRFKLPRAWGALCRAVTVADPATVGVVFPPEGLPSDFPPSSYASTAWGIAMQGVAPREYVGSTLTGASNTTCPDMWADGDTQIRQVSYGTLSGAPGAPGAGARAFLYQTVRYDTRPASDAGLQGVWLRRQNGDGNMQPLAGPLKAGAGGDAAPEGLVLTYYCGTQPIPETQLVLPTTLRTIDRIKIKIAMQSRNKPGSGGRQVQTDSVTVHLRNNNDGGVPCT
jgi:prepilin-type N-terminal cleavage/methylation domain-containing protein